MRVFCRQYSTPTIRRILITGHPRPLRQLHASAIAPAPRKRNFFSSNAALQQGANVEKDGEIDNLTPVQKRKPVRSPAGKTSLRRVAVEAQRSRSTTNRQRDVATNREEKTRVVAITVADKFDMDAVIRVLRSHGFPIDPDGTGFE